MVSIIIPTYNSAITLNECIQSIFQQTYGDYEILIIDGNSNDETIDIVKLFLNSSDKISYISEKDNGIYDAMNKGIKRAKGEWLYFLGSDDKLYNEKVLEKVFSTAGIINYDVVYGSVYNTHLQKIYDGEFNNEKMCLDGICHQSIFYKKYLFSKFGLYDPEMNVYAHIWKDKILFTDDSVNWKYLDVIVATYHGGGFSSKTMDLKYWKNAENLLNKCFKKKLSNKIIYTSLLPVPHWLFNGRSFTMALKIAVKGSSLKGLKYWFNHPYQILRLTVKKYL